ncbi:MAG: phosphodiester glycosidase family protein [Isosphaeraceae bacterium]|nr:phosphodiester glycosidase family protein [Isosphaeraceae bacterium]
MAATTPKALTGLRVLDNTPSSSKVYTDGDLYYVVMSIQTKMRLIIRTADEYFTTFVDREAVKQGVEVVVNGNYYDVNKTAMFWGVLGTSSDASNTSPEGRLVQDQRIIGGNAQPNRFYVAQRAAQRWEFGFGDPPSADTRCAIGGLGPLIINGLKYGDGNTYSAGASSSAPATGEPSPADKPYLTQRNNENFKDYHRQGARRGKTIIGHASSDGKIIVLHQRDTASTGISLEALRDKLYACGVDNAVFLDGGNSSFLWVNRVWHTKPGDNKNYTNVVGVAFDVE